MPTLDSIGRFADKGGQLLDDSAFLIQGAQLVSLFGALTGRESLQKHGDNVITSLELYAFPAKALHYFFAYRVRCAAAAVFGWKPPEKPAVDNSLSGWADTLDHVSSLAGAAQTLRPHPLLERVCTAFSLVNHSLNLYMIGNQTEKYGIKEGLKIAGSVLSISNTLAGLAGHTKYRPYLAAAAAAAGLANSIISKYREDQFDLEDGQDASRSRVKERKLTAVALKVPVKIATYADYITGSSIMANSSILASHKDWGSSFSHTSRIGRILSSAGRILKKPPSGKERTYSDTARDFGLITASALGVLTSTLGMHVPAARFLIGASFLIAGMPTLISVLSESKVLSSSFALAAWQGASAAYGLGGGSNEVVDEINDVLMMTDDLQTELPAALN